MQTQVLGTVFDVNAYPGKVAAVTLFQGRVRVSDSFLRPKAEHYNYDFFSGVDYTIDLRRPNKKEIF